MKRIALLLILTAFIVSCARLPVIVPDKEGIGEGANSSCQLLFPQGRWQVTHAIDAIVLGEEKKGLLGASVISSKDRTIQCALMTVEGFVLFSGRYDRELTVERAIPPFDRPGFAEGLIKDLMLLFFIPEAPMTQSGLTDGAQVCRFMSEKDGTIDVFIDKDQAGWIHKYSPQHKLERTVNAWGRRDISDSISFAEHMTLKRHGWVGYQLYLRLIEAVPLP